MAVGAVAVGAVVAGALRPLADKAIALLADEITGVWGLEDDLESLRQTVALIDTALEDAEERQFRDLRVRTWLGGLKAAAYDAEDVLDEILTLRRRPSPAPVSATGCLSCFSTTPCRCPVLCRSVAARMIRKIKVRFSSIAEDLKTLGLQLSGETLPPDELWEARETSSVPDRSTCLFGRNEHKTNIINELCRSDDGASSSVAPGGSMSDTAEITDSGKVSLILVTGMGGIGKTALIREIFNDPGVNQVFDKVRKWVSVGRKFNPRELLMKILGEAVLDPQGKPIDNPKLEDLHQALVKKLQDGKFLFVLDDVWNVHDDEWNQLWSALTQGPKGGKVVVTARDQNILSGVPLKVYPLPCLSDDDCKSLLTRHVLCGSSTSETERKQRLLDEFGDEMVQKLKGVPLSAQILGGFLSKADEKSWRETLIRSRLWPLADNSNDILPVLRLSYLNLSPPLKKCFAFCSVFPKNHQFVKRKLVQIWIAHDFIQPIADRSVEDVGCSYFDILIGRSFFQPVNKCYMMHDCLHDLADSISKHECLVLEDMNTTDDVMSIRHMSICDSKSECIDFSSLGGLKKMRTLLYGLEYPILPNVILRSGLFNRLKRIRVLDLSMANVLKLPGSIRMLIHLRYLDITCTGISKLPKSLCSLSNLQTLKLIEGCELPARINCLVKLRHLEVLGDPRNISKIARVGNLINLQELAAFSIKRKTGHRITELKGMSQLRELRIWNLENVDGEEEAKQAHIEAKPHLETLELMWEPGSFQSSDAGIIEGVVEGLRPPRYLRSLKILNYFGKKEPSWMNKDGLFHIVSLHLYNCRNWESLSSLGQLGSLKTLEIIGNHKLEILQLGFYENPNTSAFPSLENLIISDMLELIICCARETGYFPHRLSMLSILNCPKLVQIPRLPLHLSNLSLSNLGEFLRCAPSGSNCPSLLHLSITSCKKLPSFSSLFQYQLVSLETANIERCDELKSLWGQEAPIKLKELSIRDCPKLESSGRCLECLTSLSWLIISGSPIVKSLATDHIEHLRTLKRIDISRCDQLTDLDLQGLTFHLAADATGRYTSLTRLEFLDCKFLKLSTLQVLTSVKWLRVEKCPQLMPNNEQFAQEGMDRQLTRCPLEVLCTDNRELIAWLLHQNLMLLEELIICSCQELQSFTNEEEDRWKDLTSLKRLSINDCENLHSLPRFLKSLSLLRELHIIRCSSINKLPEDGLPNSLRYITISKNEYLKKACSKGCPDWSKVAHIPNKYIK